MVTVHGINFRTDTTELNTHLTKFISEKDTAETKIKANVIRNNEGNDYMVLKDNYGGVGVNALDAVKPGKILYYILYNGGIKRHIWWGESEKLLNE